MNFPLFLGNVPKKDTLAVPSILLLLGDSIKSFFLAFLELLGELLSCKFRFISMKADGGYSVEVLSSAGSVIASNVSVPFSKSLRKLKSRLDVPPVKAL